MRFKIATLEALPAIVQMLADDPLGKQRERFQKPLPNYYVDAFNAIAADGNQELIVAVNDKEEIIGTFQLSYLRYLTYKGGLRAQIEAVRVKKEYRGTGIGGKMLEWAIARAKEKGAHVLQLTTDKLRPEAIAFYKGHGFVATHEGMKMHIGA